MKPKASESEVFDFLTFVSVNDIDKNNRVFTIKILTLWHSLFMLEKSIWTLALVREKLFTVLKLIIICLLYTSDAADE